MPACRECAKVAVRKGQHHQISRALAQVGRGLGFLEPVAFAEDDVHEFLFGGFGYTDEDIADSGLVDIVVFGNDDQT